MKRLIGFVVAVVTWYLSFEAFTWIFTKMNVQEPGIMAFLTMVSILIHELGHLAVFELNGIRTYLFFAVLLGGAIPSDSDRYKALSWNQMAWVSMAGVLSNFLIMVVAVLLNSFGVISDYIALTLVNLNGLLIIWNLVPFGIFDGGRFRKVFFDSIPEKDDHVYASLIIAVVLIGFVGFAAWGYADNLLIYALMILGLMRGANNDDPAGSWNKLAMKPAQYRSWAAVYCALMIISMAAVAKTPFWLVRMTEN